MLHHARHGFYEGTVAAVEQFEKWHWMSIVESDYRISDAVTLQF